MPQFVGVTALEASESRGVASELPLRLTRATRRAARSDLGGLPATDDARGVRDVGCIRDNLVVADIDRVAIGRRGRGASGYDEFRCHAGSFDRGAIRDVPEPAS